MTSRIPKWREVTGVAESSSDYAFTPAETVASVMPRMDMPAAVTAGLVDEAVEGTLRDMQVSSDTAEVLRTVLSRDHASGASNAFYSSKAIAARNAASTVLQREFVVPYVLSDDEVTSLGQYAPEFRLIFRHRDSHDHAMSAATRLLDTQLVLSRVPTGVSIGDIGGNPLYYVTNPNVGQGNVHVCGPTVDKKDPQRSALRKAAIRQLAETTQKPESRILARKYLSGDKSFVCSDIAQKCDYQSRVLIAIHVYDIPMSDWPAIMEQKGCELVEGCMLFSDCLFEQKVGNMGISGARYEVDTHTNSIKMGFQGSPSWWYEHRFSEYLRYGVDQDLVGARACYSYKVTERRGDTLFFRILKTAVRPTGVAKFQYYRTPTCPVVEVHGFELDQRVAQTASQLVPRKYIFPRTLWFDMLNQAAIDFERGVMDYQKMYNHYRTISVRQTVNAVLVMGGQRVEADELVPLVVHVCLAAAAQCMLGQRTTRGLTSAAMHDRVMRDETLVKKVASATQAVLTSVGCLFLSPLLALGTLVKCSHRLVMAQSVMAWEPVAVLKRVPLAVAPELSAQTKVGESERLAVDVFNVEVQAYAMLDHYMAVENNTSLLDVIKEACPDAATAFSQPQSASVDQGSDIASSVAPPSYVTNETVSEDVQTLRKAAIQEHLAELKMMSAANTSHCARVYAEIMAQGVTPNVELLKRRAETFQNPDMWYVRNGLFINSALGLSPDTLRHSAVYHPVPDPDTGECLRAVYNRDWIGKDDVGMRLEHVNRVLSDSGFTGWVLVVDQLVVYNGPEIVVALQEALSLPHDYTVTINRGPPGCGKTHTIIHEARADGSDVIQCPVRESIIDTRQRFLSLHKNFHNAKLYVRTVDSYLTNRSTHVATRELRANRLLADECFMTHSARWYAAAALMRVRHIDAYGDENQIPHIPRVQAQKLYVAIRGQSDNYEYRSFRCPKRSVASWNEIYGHKVRSVNTVDDYMIEVRSTKGRVIPKGCVMMCMYQADKLILRQLYSQNLRDIRIITAHESEGKTFEYVWLHRFDNRKRADKSSLFDQTPHVLVAMSRHTRGFLYCCPANLGDEVSRRIENGNQTSQMALAADVASLGSSVIT